MRRATRRACRGATLVWAIIMMIVLIGLVGLATDVGYTVLIAHQLQNTADAAALAGAQQIKHGESEVRLAAQNTAAANFAAKSSVQLNLNGANAPNGDIVLGRYDRDSDTFDPTLDTPNAVKVIAPRTTSSLNGGLPLFFAPIFGVAEIDVERYAIAMNQGGTGAGLIALSPDANCALYVRGNATLNVNDGAIQVNSDHPNAACAQGSVTVDAPDINVQGGFHEQGVPNITGNVNEGQPPIQDPLAWLPDPSWDPAQDLGSITTGGTYDPGYYSGGIDVQGNAIVTLNPGIYIVDGAGLQVGGTATFTANEVMFFVIGDGYVNIDGTGEITVTPPQSGPWEGVSIFQARDNCNTSTIIGTGLLDLQGSLYFPCAHLEIGGTGDGFGNQLIANTIEIFGAGVKTIVYDGSNPAPGNFVFLVE